MALRRKNVSFSAHNEPLCGTRQQASDKESEVFVAVVKRWRDGWDRVGWGSRRSDEEKAGGICRRQHNTLIAARLVTGGVCVCVCLVYWR
jgi:hypothetical protein